MIESVADLIGGIRARMPIEVGRELDRLEARLREPLRVAVVGRVNAGKSTLVNALLGLRVAPTDVSECTRVVTWFRYGHPQRVTVRLQDGRELDLQLTPEGMLPSTLPVPLAEVATLDAYLANEPLRSMTLIDTPGIGSVHGTLSASTEELLTARTTADAAASADAVVFLLNQPVMADELDTLRGFTDRENAAGGAGPATAVGVLGRADQIASDSRRPWRLALELASHYAQLFRHDVATIVPVMGLIAETAEAASLTEPDARHLAQLASMDPKSFDRLMWSVDRFVTGDAPVPVEGRQRLLQLLDLYGVGCAVEFLRAGGHAQAAAVRRELASISGIAEVKRMLASYFREQDHVLKVRSALELLRRLSYSRAAGQEAAALVDLRTKVDALKLDPAMHPIAELELLHEGATGALTLPDDLMSEMRRVLGRGNVQTRLAIHGEEGDAVRSAAQEGMIRWRRFMNTEASPTQARACRVVMRTYQILWNAAS
jgi:hypothetical protein